MERFGVSGLVAGAVLGILWAIVLEGKVGHHTDHEEPRQDNSPSGLLVAVGGCLGAGLGLLLIFPMGMGIFFLAGASAPSSQRPGEWSWMVPFVLLGAFGGLVLPFLFERPRRVVIPSVVLGAATLPLYAVVAILLPSNVR